MGLASRQPDAGLHQTEAATPFKEPRILSRRRACTGNTHIVTSVPLGSGLTAPSAFASG